MREELRMQLRRKSCVTQLRDGFCMFLIVLTKYTRLRAYELWFGTMNSRFSSPRGASRGRARGPRVATCYICGRAYGISSLKVHPGARVLVRSVSAEKVRGFLQIHQKSCKALWEKREALKPKVCTFFVA